MFKRIRRRAMVPQSGNELSRSLINNTPPPSSNDRARSMSDGASINRQRRASQAGGLDLLADLLHGGDHQLFKRHELTPPPTPIHSSSGSDDENNNDDQNVDDSGGSETSSGSDDVDNNKNNMSNTSNNSNNSSNFSENDIEQHIPPPPLVTNPIRSSPLIMNDLNISSASSKSEDSELEYGTELNGIAQEEKRRDSGLNLLEEIMHSGSDSHLFKEHGSAKITDVDVDEDVNIDEDVNVDEDVDMDIDKDMNGNTSNTSNNSNTSNTSSNIPSLPPRPTISASPSSPSSPSSVVTIDAIRSSENTRITKVDARLSKIELLCQEILDKLSSAETIQEAEPIPAPVPALKSKQKDHDDYFVFQPTDFVEWSPVEHQVARRYLDSTSNQLLNKVQQSRKRLETANEGHVLFAQYQNETRPRPKYIGTTETMKQWVINHMTEPLRQTPVPEIQRQKLQLWKKKCHRQNELQMKKLLRAADKRSQEFTNLLDKIGKTSRSHYAP